MSNINDLVSKSLLEGDLGDAINKPAASGQSGGGSFFSGLGAKLGNMASGAWDSFKGAMQGGKPFTNEQAAQYRQNMSNMRNNQIQSGAISSQTLKNWSGYGGRS